MADDEGERILQEVAKKMTDDMMAALSGASAFKSPRPTALRLTPGGAFEVVDLDDAGKPIERCRKCGPVLLCSDCMSRIT